MESRRPEAAALPPAPSGGREEGGRLRELPRPVGAGVLVPIAVASAIGVLAARIALTSSARVTVMLALLAVAGVTIVLQPFLGVAAYFLFAFLRPQDLFWGFGQERLTLIVALSTLGATALHLLRRPDLRVLLSRHNLLVLILWAFLYLSTVFGEFARPEPRWTNYYAKMFVIFFVVVLMVDSPRKLRALVWIIALSVGYLGWWANERYFLQGVWVVSGPGRPGYTFYDHNDFAMLLVMAVPFLWYLIRSPGPPLVLRLALLVPLALVAHAVMLTYSRGGFLGLLAVGAFVLWKERNRRFAAGLAIVGAVAIVAVAGQNYRDRIGSIGDFESDGSATGRLESWEAGRGMLTSNPIFGVGLKQYVRAYPRYSSTHPRVAHNSWVQLGAEAGGVALLAYAGLVLLTIRSLRRIEKAVDDPRFPAEESGRTRTLALVLGGALVGYLVCGFFLSAEDLEFFYLIVAMAQGLERWTLASLGGPAPEPAALAGPESVAA